MNTISKLAIAGLLAAAASAPALADHRGFTRGRLLDLALQVESSAGSLHWNAERTAHHGAYAEERALARLHALDEQARDFRATLQARGPFSPRTSRDFDDLVSVFDRARRAFPGLHARRPVEREFRSLEASVCALQDEYAATLAASRPAPIYGHPSRGVQVSVGYQGSHGSIQGTYVDGGRWPGEYADDEYRDDEYDDRW
jgi:hypothetical protein